MKHDTSLTLKAVDNALVLLGQDQSDLLPSVQAPIKRCSPLDFLATSDRQIHCCVNIIFNDSSEVIDLDATTFILIHELE